MMLNVFLLLCSIQSIVNGVGLHGFTFRGLKEPEPLAKNAIINEGWITQPVDHFNHRDNRTWNMVIICYTIIFSQSALCLTFINLFT